MKKPGCGDEILAYFRQHPETGVTGPHHIAIVGDRLATDMMLANMMGSWGVWVKEGVVPLQQKSIVRIKKRWFQNAPLLICPRSSPEWKGSSRPTYSLEDTPPQSRLIPLNERTTKTRNL